MDELTTTIDCPRCGQAVRELHPLPEAVLKGTPGEGEGGGGVTYGRACEWCRHEILEG